MLTKPEFNNGSYNEQVEILYEELQDMTKDRTICALVTDLIELAYREGFHDGFMAMEYIVNGEFPKKQQ